MTDSIKWFQPQSRFTENHYNKTKPSMVFDSEGKLQEHNHVTLKSPNNKQYYDLDEYLYHIDRMMTAFVRAGVLDNVRGLIVGGLTKMHDNAVPFGMSAEEIILEKVRDRNIPVTFGFPAGHIDDNRALVLGRKFRM